MITLATLAAATDQQIFDQVAKHLLTQNEQSTMYKDCISACAYRGSHGLKCAAGCLIADDEYTKAMERKTWVPLAAVGKVPEEHVYLVSDLQNIHDLYDPPKWQERLQILAERYNLNDDILEITT